MSSHHGTGETNPTNICEDAGLIPGLSQWAGESSIADMAWIGHRHDLDPGLLWLWYRPAAVAPIRSLAWELPYAKGVILLKRQTKNFLIKKIKINQKITQFDF